jgi:hypothetical protein
MEYAGPLLNITHYKSNLLMIRNSYNSKSENLAETIQPNYRMTLIYQS